MWWQTIVELALIALLVFAPFPPIKALVNWVIRDTSNVFRLGLGLLLSLVAFAWGLFCFYISAAFLWDYPGLSLSDPRGLEWVMIVRIFQAVHLFAVGYLIYYGHGFGVVTVNIVREWRADILGRTQ